MIKGDETDSVDSSVWNVWNDPLPRFGRVIRLLRDEVHFLEDFLLKCEGVTPVEERVRELEEAIAILTREGGLA